MSFWEALARDNYGSAAFWFLIAVWAGIVWIIIRVTDAITEIKEAKYQALSASVGYNYDLYEFAHWLSEAENSDKALTYEGLVDVYIKEKADD